MIQFLDELVRTRFHSLSVDKQKEWSDIAEQFLKSGKFVTILFIGQDDKDGLEISIRVDRKFNDPRG